MVFRTVGRGPVPRHASRTPTFAGDRPPRYGEKTALHRRERACLSPSSVHSNVRGGQAPALRIPARPFFLSVVCDRLIANSRAPHSTRPTVNGTLFFPVARGPVPRECSTRAKNARRLTPFSVPIEARRGTGPRPTVNGDGLAYRSAGTYPPRAFT